MSTSSQILIILGLLTPLLVKARKDYISALAYAVFLFVSMTTYLRIEMPGNLPQFTVHRIVLIVLFFLWRRTRRLPDAPKSPPVMKYLAFWAAINFISMLLTDADFVGSFKRFLDYTLEIYAFYYIIATSLRTRDDAYRILDAAAKGLALVAALAFIERYTGFNPVRKFYSVAAEDWSGIQSTYQHRILLGTAMAMGAPLLLALNQSTDQRGFGRFRRWIVFGMLLGTCYFANSRGPWLACGLALAILAFLGPPQFRRGLALTMFCGLIILVARPGVAETLTNRAAESADSDSFKGGTFRYRLELWKVAWHEISKSPVRILFGYGPAAGAATSIEWKLSYRGTTMLIESWDNQFAYDFYQAGCLGLLATILLYSKLVRDMYGFWSNARPEQRGELICIFASVAALVFMMTNVMIFAKQLHYLFWSVIAAGYVLPSDFNMDDATQLEHSRSEDPIEDASVDVYPELIQS